MSEKQKLIERVPIEGSPFTAVKIEEKWFLTLGMYIVSPQVATMAELTDMVEKAPWDLIMNVMDAMMKAAERQKEVENKKTNNKKVKA